MLLVVALSIVKLFVTLVRFISCFWDQDHVDSTYVSIPGYSRYWFSSLLFYLDSPTWPLICWLLQWKLRKKHASHSPKMLHPFGITLHIVKRIWAIPKKKQKKIPVPKKHGKKKEKKKDSSYLKIKDRVMQKGVRVSSRRIPHTCTSWSDCMTYFLYWIRFLSLQYMRNMYASFLFPVMSSTKKPY